MEVRQSHKKAPFLQGSSLIRALRISTDQVQKRELPKSKEATEQAFQKNAIQKEIANEQNSIG